MRRLMVGAILLLVLLVPSLTWATGENEPGFVVAAGDTYPADVATFSQPIVINGVVEGDVTSVTGSIVVRGAVEGDVVSLFGDVSFEPQAVTEGNVMAAVGEVHLPTTVQVAAEQTVFNGNLAGQTASSLIPGVNGEKISSLNRVLTILILSSLGLLISALFGLIWPRSIASAAQAVRLAPDRAAGLGLIWLLITTVLVSLVAAVLILSLLGLAVLPLLLLLTQVPYLAGLAVVGRVLGERLNLHGRIAQIVGAALVFVPVIAVAPWSMIAAFIGYYLLAGVGIGGLILLRVSVAYRHSALV